MIRSLGFLFFAAAIALFACAEFAPAETTAEPYVEWTSALERCRQVGRDAGSYAAYEACTREAGL